MFTVIRAVSVAVPPGPVAVAWYVTDDAGFTERFPVAPTSPNPGSMRTFAAFLASHVNVVFWPRLIVVGFARNVIAGAGGGGGAVGGGGGGGGGGGAAATLFLQPNASREAVRTTNATFLMREELIACLLVESYWGYPDHAGPVFLPVFVSCRTFVPSRSME